MEAGTLPDYIHNLATKENEPFYVIDQKHQTAFAYFLEHWQFPETEEQDNPVPAADTSRFPAEPLLGGPATNSDTETSREAPSPVPEEEAVVVPAIVTPAAPPTPETAPAAPPPRAAPTLDKVVQKTSLHAGKFKYICL